jgi:hypothetical protein
VPASSSTPPLLAPGRQTVARQLRLSARASGLVRDAPPRGVRRPPQRGARCMVAQNSVTHLRNREATASWSQGYGSSQAACCIIGQEGTSMLIDTVQIEYLLSQLFASDLSRPQNRSDLADTRVVDVGRPPLSSRRPSVLPPSGQSVAVKTTHAHHACDLRLPAGASRYHSER